MLDVLTTVVVLEEGWLEDESSMVRERLLRLVKLQGERGRERVKVQKKEQESCQWQLLAVKHWH